MVIEQETPVVVVELAADVEASRNSTMPLGPPQDYHERPEASVGDFRRALLSSLVRLTV